MDRAWDRPVRLRATRPKEGLRNMDTIVEQAAPTAPEVSPAVLAALAQLEAAKENLKRVRAQEALLRREGGAAAREARKLAQAQEEAPQLEAAKAEKLGRDPAEVRTQASMAQAAGFVRGKVGWARGDQLLNLTAQGWIHGKVGQRDWMLVSRGEADGGERTGDLARYLLPG